VDSRRKQAVLLVVAGLTVAALAAYSIAGWVMLSRPGWSGASFATVNEAGGTAVEVRDVHPVSPAARAGIRPGDIVLSIDGRRFAEAGDAEEVNRALRPGATAHYDIRRGGSERTLNVRLVDAIHRPGVIADIALNALVAALFLAVGVFVYLKRPDDSRAVLLFITCLLFGASRLLATGPVAVYSWSLGATILVTIAWTGLAFLIFPALLHFCLIFPNRRPVLDNHPALLRWIYGLPAATALLLTGLTVSAIVYRRGPRMPLEGLVRAAATPLFDWLEANAAVSAAAVCALLAPLVFFLVRRWRRLVVWNGWSAALLSHPGLALFSIALAPIAADAVLQLAGVLTGRSAEYRQSISSAVLILVGTLVGLLMTAQSFGMPAAACVALFRSYREAGVAEKQQIRWPLWGLTTGLAGYLLAHPLANAITWLLGWERRDPGFAAVHYTARHLATLALVLIPISFAFAILKHRLMDINVYIRRTVIYGAVTGFLGLIYLLLAGGLGGLISRFAGVRSDWMAIASTLVVAVAFVPVRNRIQAVLDRRFFRRRSDYSSALERMVREIAEASTQRALVSGTVDRIQQAVQNRLVVLFLRQPEEGAYFPAAEVGLSADAGAELRVPVGAETESALAAVGRVPAAGPWRRLAARGCALLAPIRRRGELLGFLALGSKLSEEDFDAEDEQFLAAAAGQIAIGLDNLRLEEQQLEFDRAREIQEALLPRRIPQAPGVEIAGCWQPARAVGGDYYDVLDLGEGRLALVIADVAGKGLPAALLMSNLQAAVKAFAGDVRSPAELSSRLNRMLCGNLAPGKFITFFYGILDTGTRTLLYTNAGHTPPILSRARGGVVRLESGGMVLGFSSAAAYDQEQVVLDTGDRLLLYTDGLSEAFGSNDEEFGDDRLEAIVRGSDVRGAEDLQRRVLDAVATFCHHDFHDDATLIAVIVKQAGAASAS
jgi:serine phosphatase RsbU (regulator of sigma subunit)